MHCLLPSLSQNTTENCLFRLDGTALLYASDSHETEFWNDSWKTDSHMTKSFVMLTGDCKIRTRYLKISTVLGEYVGNFPRVKVRTVISWYFSLLNVYCDFMI